MTFFHSIKFKFTIWYLLVLAILLLLLSVGIYYGLSHGLRSNLDDSLKLRTEQLTASKANLRDSINQGSFQEKLGEVVSVFYVSSNQLIQVSRHGVEIPIETQTIMNAIEGEKVFTTQKTSEGNKLRMYSVPYTVYEDSRFFPGGSPFFANKYRGALVVGRSMENIDDALSGLKRILFFANLATLFIAGAGGIFLAKRALKPVDDIALTAYEIEKSGDLGQRIRVHTKDELGTLSSILNQMIERLELAFNRQKEFTGDASHELRTPLAVIEAESTLALQKDRTKTEYRQSLETIAQESSHMSAIISKLLALARADTGVNQLTLSEFDLGELLGEISADAKILCHDKGLTFESDSFDDITINGDRDKLRELILNLIDNGIRYNVEGGSVSLLLEQNTNEVVISVKDTGMGIPPEEIDRIFERFYRVDKARSRAEGGSGLGLAICRHIVEAHNGRIEVVSKPEKGSTFSVSLPVNAS